MNSLSEIADLVDEQISQIGRSGERFKDGQGFREMASAIIMYDRDIGALSFQFHR